MRVSHLESVYLHGPLAIIAAKQRDVVAEEYFQAFMTSGGKTVAEKICDLIADPAVRSRLMTLVTDAK